jgi:hypothetical protein
MHTAVSRRRTSRGCPPVRAAELRQLFAEHRCLIASSFLSLALVYRDLRSWIAGQHSLVVLRYPHPKVTLTALDQHGFRGKVKASSHAKEPNSTLLRHRRIRSAAFLVLV